VKKFKLFWITVSLFLSGCAQNIVQMYSGSRLPENQVAMIETTGSLRTVIPKAAAVVVKRIDGKETGVEKTAIMPPIEVLPGTHSLDLRLSRSLGTTDTGGVASSGYKEYTVDKTLDLVAQAGHKYRIYGVLDTEQTFPWFVWIEDLKDGKVVSGTKPK
jgi:hypothetical protein